MSQLAQRLTALDGIEFEDLSDSYMTRLRVNFPNGYSLSVIRNRGGQGGFGGSYGAESGLVEIALYDGEGEFTQILWPDHYDDVMGWMTHDDVMNYAEKAAALPKWLKTISHTEIKELS